MSAYSTIAAVLTLVVTGATAFGQNRQQPDFDFAGQDAARRAAEARFRDDQVRNQEAARLAQQQAVREQWWSRLCYLVTAVVFVGCLFTPSYAAGAAFRHFEHGKLRQTVFYGLFVLYMIPLLVGWSIVAVDYAPKRAALSNIVATGRPFPADLAFEAEEARERRVAEVKASTWAELALRELPHLFDAVAHAYKEQRGVVYIVLLAEAMIAGVAVGLASRLGPAEGSKRKPVATLVGLAVLVGLAGGAFLLWPGPE